MASTYEKLVKKIVDTFNDGLSPLKTMVQNQEIIIIQNKKIIELLDSVSSKISAPSIERPHPPSE